MEHIAALLLMVGCSDSLAECRELPTPAPVIYETLEECEADKPMMLREMNGNAPRIIAACVETDPALEYEDATLEWDVTRDGRLVAAIEPVTGYAVALQAERNRQARTFIK